MAEQDSTLDEIATAEREPADAEAELEAARDRYSAVCEESGFFGDEERAARDALNEPYDRWKTARQRLRELKLSPRELALVELGDAETARNEWIVRISEAGESTAELMMHHLTKAQEDVEQAIRAVNQATTLRDLTLEHCATFDGERVTFESLAAAEAVFAEWMLTLVPFGPQRIDQQRRKARARALVERWREEQNEQLPHGHDHVTYAWQAIKVALGLEEFSARKVKGVPAQVKREIDVAAVRLVEADRKSWPSPGLAPLKAGGE
jgi:DNA repair exonuclease SbcCD ATPase subunit